MLLWLFLKRPRFTAISSDYLCQSTDDKLLCKTLKSSPEFPCSHFHRFASLNQLLKTKKFNFVLIYIYVFENQRLEWSGLR